MDYFVFDVETPNSANDRICSIGYAVICDGKITETDNVLVNPECEFCDMNIAIHGITPDDVADAPRFPQIWSSLEALMSGRVLVAHNAYFDLNVLGKVLRHYQLPTGRYAFADTLALARHCYPELDNHKLNTLCDYLSIQLSHHNSGSDANAAAELLLRVEKEGTLKLWDYIRMFDFSEESGTGHYRTRFSNVTLALNELKDMLIRITADSQIEQDEFKALNHFILEHIELNGNYPFDKIFDRLQLILDDGVATATELEELNILCEQLADPVNAESFEPQAFSVEGKNIVLTGDFAHGSRGEITKLLVEMGANVLNSVTKKTDIVLVGDYGSDAWVAGNYGTKVKKAMELRDKGLPISIIRENDFFKFTEEYKWNNSL